MKNTWGPVPGTFSPLYHRMSLLKKIPDWRITRRTQNTQEMVAGSVYPQHTDTSEVILIICISLTYQETIANISKVNVTKINIGQ